MGRESSIVLERRFVPEGTMIMRQGEPGNSAYLIQSGCVSVYTEHEGKIVELAKLDLGQIFGEMALIFDDPRTASVKALEDCNLIVITRQSFQQKLNRSDPTIKAIVGMLSQRIVTANNAVVNKQSDMTDMVDTVNVIYQNVLATLPRSQQRTFQNGVFPKLEEFLNAVKAFGERFPEEAE